MRFKTKKRCPFCSRLLNKTEFSPIDLGCSDLICCECNSRVGKDDAMKICKEKGFSDVWGKHDELEYTYSVVTRLKKGKSLKRRRTITFLDNCMIVEDDYINDDKKEINIQYEPIRARYEYIQGHINILVSFPEKIRGYSVNVF